MARPSRINFIYKHPFAVLPKRTCTRVTSVHQHAEASENLSGSFLQTFGKIATDGLKALFKHHLPLPKFCPFGNLAHSFYEAPYQKVVEIHQATSNCNSFFSIKEKRKKKNNNSDLKNEARTVAYIPPRPDERRRVSRYLVVVLVVAAGLVLSIRAFFFFFSFFSSFFLFFFLSQGVSDKGILRIL